MADSNSDGREPQKPFSITGYIRTAEGDQKALATARNALEHLQAKRKRLADEKKVAKDQGKTYLSFPNAKINP